jgi:streptomycin 6-kinase
MRITVGDHGQLELPQVLLNNLRAVHRERVVPWLERLPTTLAAVLDELDATIEPGDPGLSYNLVFFARRASDEQIVIKATVPNEEQRAEVAGVDALSGAGLGPRLLWSDLDRGVLAMERIVPGGTLPTHIPTLEEDRDIVGTIGRLAGHIAREVDVTAHRDGLVTVREYTRTLDTFDETSAIWRDHRDEVDRARVLRDAMLRDPDQPHGFVHGDLHHYNILLDETGKPRPIDPKGLIGPIGYDFGVMSYDPMQIQQHPDLPALFGQRVTVWAEATGLPWEVVRDWGYVGAMVSACWDAEDGGDSWHDTLRSARTMRELTPPR